MTTMIIETVRITIDAPFEQVTSDLADSTTQHEWATEFFAGPARSVGDCEVLVTVPRMGGEARMKVDADPVSGHIDLYLAPVGAPYGPPLPVGVVPNPDGVDVLFALARFPGQSDTEWDEGIASMARELENLKARHEH